MNYQLISLIKHKLINLKFSICIFDNNQYSIKNDKLLMIPIRYESFESFVFYIYLDNKYLQTNTIELIDLLKKESNKIYHLMIRDYHKKLDKYSDKYVEYNQILSTQHKLLEVSNAIELNKAFIDILIHINKNYIT